MPIREFSITMIRHLASKAMLEERDQLSGVSEKQMMANNDRFLIEDSEDGYSKKYVKKSSLPGSGSGIPSNPPVGHYTVVNLYVDSGTGRLVVEYDDTPEP